MSVAALSWFSKNRSRIRKLSDQAVLHVICFTEPEARRGKFFKVSQVYVAKQTGQSRTTIRRCYERLIEGGWIEARPVEKSAMYRINFEVDSVIEDPAKHGTGCAKQHGTGCATNMAQGVPQTWHNGVQQYIQEQGSGGATPKPEPDPCSTEKIQAKDEPEDPKLRRELLEARTNHIKSGNYTICSSITQLQIAAMLKKGMVTLEELKAVGLRP